MTRITVSVSGLKDIEKALAELPKATARNVAIRALTKAAMPMYEQAKAHAPERPADAPPHYYGKKGERKLRRPGTLHAIVQIGTRLTRNQASIARKQGKDFAEVYVGTRDPMGRLIEFGTYQAAPQPFLRPAWDANKEKALEIVKTELWNEISKAAARLAKKAAKGKVNG